MHSPDAPTYATCGPGAPACATRSLNVFVRAARSLGSTLHRAP
jgi:hypothetical protein